MFSSTSFVNIYSVLPAREDGRGTLHPVPVHWMLGREPVHTGSPSGHCAYRTDAEIRTLAVLVSRSAKFWPGKSNLGAPGGQGRYVTCHFSPGSIPGPYDRNYLVN